MMDPLTLPPPLPPALSPDPAIDPALALPLDPAILGDPSPNDQPAPASPGAAPPFPFAQGPQGDPFAPQAPLPPPSPSPPPARPAKRKRRPRPAARRDDECSFCQGDDARNKAGRAEQMVSCVVCGRSGHPSCLNIAGIAGVLRSYDWHCIECKICEVCQKKGNGNRMLFCDACDRGWHMDCLDPPLEDTPNGSWVCPVCPPIPPPPPGEGGPSTPLPFHVSVSPAPSAASSSQAAPQNEPRSRLRNAGKNHRRAPAHAQSETDEDERPRVRHKNDAEARGVNRTRGKAKGKIKVPADVKGKGRARPPAEAHTLRLPRVRVSMRARSVEDDTSPDPPIHATRKVRLVVNKPKVVHDEDEDEDEDDGSPRHMFEGILTPAQYNTANTAIHDSDRSLFNRSRTRAESKLGPPVAPIFPSALFTPGPATPAPSTPAGPSSLLHSLRTRHSVAQALHFQTALETPPGTPQPAAAANTPLPPRIRTIRFGEYDVDTWYDAPFPEEYASVADGKLWMCEFCLKYMKSQFQAKRHRMKCKARHPPGDEIYRDGTISVFEVDGRKNKIYCQNLCLLSKMFLDHKSLFYDVEPFLFYVMTEVDRLGARFVGYFSKEKRSPKDYNVSCIMTLPVRQRRGWGNILIDFSYLLSKKENRVGSPERPLSTLGSLAYKQYWTHTVKLFLHTAQEPVTLEDISRGTSMTLEDIYNTLREHSMITSKEVTPPPPPRPPPGTPIKYLRGRKNGPGITRRGIARNNTKEEAKAQLVIPTEYTIHWDHAALDAYVAAWLAKEHVTIKARCLKWSPFLLTREPKTQTTEAEDKTVQTPAETAVQAQELDRSSASSTQVPQVPVDVAVCTPKHPGESALLELAIAAEMRSPQLVVEVEDSKQRVPRSPSHDANHAVEDLVAAVELAQKSSPRVLRTRSRSLRETSADQARASPSASENVSQRVLRPRASANNVKRTRKSEEEESSGGATDTMQDGALAARLAQEDSAPQRRTRSSSYKTNPPEPPKPATPRTSPRKRRRVESSPEPEPEPDPEYDADGSLSTLTRTSHSPTPPPISRRVTRALNGKLPNGSPRQNGTVSNGSIRSTRSDAQPLVPVRSSSRINGAIHLPVVKRPATVGEIRVGRTRSTRRNKASSIPDEPEVESKDSTEDPPEDNVSLYERKEEEEDGEGETEDADADAETDENAASVSNSMVATEAQCVNGTGPDKGVLGAGGTPALYDEDALGEEDAEGEEDPDPDSNVES